MRKIEMPKTAINKAIADILIGCGFCATVVTQAQSDHLLSGKVCVLALAVIGAITNFINHIRDANAQTLGDGEDG